MRTFKDLFSFQAEDYAKFRPQYSSEVFNYLSSLVAEKNLAWDVATGNGQAALFLAESFTQVIATDASAAQIKNAVLHDKITYSVGSAEKSDLKSQSVDLITVAQAFHWFNQKEFFAECARVAKPGAVLAFWCYELAQINPEVDEQVLYLYNEVLGPYWEKERALVDDGYRSVAIPFAEIKAPAFKLKAEWNLKHLLGYLSTWSALQTYIKKNGHNPLQDFYPRLEKAWGADMAKPVIWDLSMRVARI